MDLARIGFRPSRRLKKSQTQHNLHRKRGKSTKNKLPTLQERKAGGIYGFNSKAKQKPTPFKVQLDYLYKDCIGSYIPGASNRNVMTCRAGENLNQLDKEQLHNIRKEFVQNAGPNRHDPITHKPFYNYQNRKQIEDAKMKELMATLVPRNDSDLLELSSDREESPKKEPAYKNLI